VRDTIEGVIAAGENQRGFAEIEVASQTILIQLTITDELIEGILEDITAR
jgi:hypothetical protein